MKIGTALFEGQRALVIAPELSTQFLDWKKLQSIYPREKLLQQVSDFESLLRSWVSLGPFLLAEEKKWAGEASLAEGELVFDRPFQPLQFRDFYCFEEHVKKGRKSRGLEMIPEWYEAPVFYYSNALNCRGPGDILYPTGSKAMDCELEIGCVLGQDLYNASDLGAADAIMGYCLLNDWTARDFQSWEMKLNMGPTKGKDFCSSFGPYVVTKESLVTKREKKGYDLGFELLINGEKFTHANWKTIHYSFEEMLLRASSNCKVFAGELIGSGTMGGGCLLEWNSERDDKRWLQTGDHVELLCAELGLSLKNQITGEM